MAAGLVNSSFLRYGGRIRLSDVLPSVASFASLSAASLPAIPLCPAVWLARTLLFSSFSLPGLRLAEIL